MYICIYVCIYILCIYVCIYIYTISSNDVDLACLCYNNYHNYIYIYIVELSFGSTLFFYS